jgi:hypothetical protein
MAPEAFVGRPCAGSDSWSFMVLLWTLATRRRLAHAFPGGVERLMLAGHETLADAVADPDSGIAARAAQGERARFEDLGEGVYVPAAVRCLIEAGWANDPEKRPSFVPADGNQPTMPSILDSMKLLEQFEEQFEAEEQAHITATALRNAPGKVATVAWLEQHSLQRSSACTIAMPSPKTKRTLI